MTTQSKRTVAFALCGSFCSFAAVLPQLRVLTARGWDVLPVLSASAAGLDTRFGTAAGILRGGADAYNGQQLPPAVNQRPHLGQYGGKAAKAAAQRKGGCAL